MNNNISPLIRINKIYIKNYKAIDELEIEFTKPRMEDDVDVFVLGSGNGVGKTSVLECCSLFFLLFTFKKASIERFIRKYLDMIISAGQEESVVKITIEAEGEEFEFEFKLNKTNGLYGFGSNKKFGAQTQRVFLDYLQNKAKSLNFLALFSTLFGINPNPLLIPCLSYFHSFRKVSEGNTQLRAITNPESNTKQEILPSTFKMEVMQLLMSKVGLFEGVNEKDAEISLDKLNVLVKTYAKGEIKKLKSLPDESIDLLITTGKADTSHPFDSLSSGQKEIINTLFLVWKNTAQTPGIVLIDEPELHLNSEWHRGIVSSLKKIAPWNQYILATHSEDVFASVDSNHRILIEKN